MPNPIVHIEFHVKDADGSRAWYEKVFGWTSSYHSEMNYASLTFEEGFPVGVGLNPTEEMSGTVAYVGTDDIEALFARALAEGAEALVEISPIPNIGRFALLKTPDGTVLGLFEGSGGAS